LGIAIPFQCQGSSKTTGKGDNPKKPGGKGKSENISKKQLVGDKLQKLYSFFLRTGLVYMSKEGLTISTSKMNPFSVKVVVGGELPRILCEKFQFGREKLHEGKGIKFVA